MRQSLSLLTLLFYGMQLLASCGPVAGGDEGQPPRSAGTSSLARLTGDTELIAPPGTVVDTQVTEGLTAGDTQGSASVTADGAATYSLPLWVPPGRAGMQPVLALTYNSRAGRGVAGMGFGIGGTPSRITRCHKTLAQDGAAAPVRFDNSDVFCLDGSRLVLVSTDKSYGSDGSEYRTEVDSFAKVTLHKSAPNGPPDSFEVRQKNGRILLYGTQPEARLEGLRTTLTQAPPEGIHVQYTSQVRYAWALSEVKDRQGNFMQLRYALLGAPSLANAYEHHLMSIHYTGSHTDASVAQPLRRVEFEYASDTVEDTYVSGFKVRSASRLAFVRMYAPDVPSSPTLGGPTVLWRTYKLEYRGDSISGRSLLKSVQECDGRDVCKPATTFDWELGSEQFQTLNTGITDVAANGYATDVDGNLHVKARDLWNLQLADVNGDGKDDLLYRYMRFSTTAGYRPAVWRLRLSTGSGFGNATTVSLPESQVGDPMDDLAMVDMDMDGRTDVLALNRADCAPEVNVNGHYQLYRFDGSDFIPFLTDNSELYDICNDPVTDVKPPGLQVTDLNGDGLPDLLRSWRPRLSDALSATEWAWRTNQLASMGSLSFPGYTSFNFNSGVDHAGFVTDVDGDGASEVLLRKPDTWPNVSGSPDGFAGYYTAVGVNPTGSRREVETTLSALPWDYGVGSGPYHSVNTWLADFTGDGLPDALTLIKEHVPHDGVARELRLSINTGNGFLPPQTLAVPAGSLPGPAQWLYTGRVIDNGLRILDFNMDGRQDLLLTEYFNDRGVTRTHLTVLLSTGTGFVTKVLSIPVDLATGNGAEAPNGSRVDLEGSGWGQKLTRVADVNGDGLQDIVQVVGSFQSNQLVVHLRQGSKPDLLKSVTEGNGRWMSFLHRSLLRDTDLYTPESCTYPQYCGVRGIWVVGSFMADTGLEDGSVSFRWSQFTYAGGRTDLRGRGWLGFARRQVSDMLTNRVATTWYDNKTRTGTMYLHAGLPFREEVSTPLASGTRALSSEFVREPMTSTQGKTYFLCPVSTTSEEMDSSFGPISSITTTQHCDDYGNITYIGTLTSAEPATADAIRMDRTLQMENHPSTWVLGLPRRVTDKLSTPASSRHPNGQETTRVTTYQYCPTEPCPESNLLWRATVEPEGTDDLRLVTTYGRDITGQVTSITSTHATATTPRVESLRYDTFEKLFPTVLLNAANHRTDVAYHPGLGVVALVEDANGVRVRSTYDRFGRSREQTAPYREGSASGGASLFVDYQREALGRTVVTSRREGTPTVVQRLDRWGRERSVHIQTFDGAWSNTTTSYDMFGRVERTTAPRFEQEPEKATTLMYDNLDRPLKQINPDGTYQEWVYEGHRTRFFSEQRNESILTRNPLGQVVKVEERKDSQAPWLTTEYLYAPFGLLDSVKDPGGALTTMDYDARGRRTKLTEPKIGTLVTSYDAFDDIREETDAAGLTTSYTNDALGRELLISNCTDGITRFIWDTAPNGVGALTRAENQRISGTSTDDIVTNYGYDTLGRLTQEVLSLNGTAHTVNQGYDALGRLDTLTYPSVPGQQSRLAVQNTYTATGYPASVRDLFSGLEYWRVQDRDASGRATLEALGNGITTRHRRDGRGRLRFIESRAGMAGALVQSLAYSYYADDNLRSRHDVLARVSENFQYDGLDRLTRWDVR